MEQQRRSGSYKKARKKGFKTVGLSSEESMRATTLKGKKVSAGQLKKANVLADIGTTRWETGKGVVGPGGKAFTGSVILASGSTATYVKGRRVGVSTKKAAPPRRNPTGNPTANPTNDPPPTRPRGFKQAARRQEKIAVSRGGTKAIKTGLKPAQSSTTSNPQTSAQTKATPKNRTRSSARSVKRRSNIQEVWNARMNRYVKVGQRRPGPRR